MAQFALVPVLVELGGFLVLNAIADKYPGGGIPSCFILTSVGEECRKEVENGCWNRIRSYNPSGAVRFMYQDNNASRLLCL